MTNMENLTHGGVGQNHANKPSSAVVGYETLNKDTIYAEKYMQTLNWTVDEIKRKQEELAQVAAQSVNNPKAPKESYVKLMDAIRGEISRLEYRRDNLHTGTVH